jgi:hypothetical protein
MIQGFNRLRKKPDVDARPLAHRSKIALELKKTILLALSRTRKTGLCC